MNTDAPSFTPEQLERFAKLHVTYMSDPMIQLDYPVADQRWDEAAQIILLHQQQSTVLAGCISQLLPQTSGGDAPVTNFPCQPAAPVAKEAP